MRTLPILATAALVGGCLLAMPRAIQAQNVGDAVADGLVDRFQTVSGHVLAAAEQVPENQYSYRPTVEVRTFGELVDHVADAHFGYCSAAGDGNAPAASETDASSKDQIVERFRASRDFCNDVYQSADGGSLGQTVSIFGGEDTRAGVLIQNVAHDNLHYGNIVTYMRALGMVPPSSQGGS